MEKMIQKSVRLPAALVDFINAQPGNGFTDKLIQLIEEYKSGDLERRLILQRYDEQITERRRRLEILVQNINQVSRISRKVEALMNEVDSLESADTEERNVLNCE